MNRFFATVVLGTSVMLGFSGSHSSAAVTIYDDFPGDSLNASLWTNVGGTVTVSGSNINVGDPSGWSSLFSTQSFGDASAQQGYVFKLAGFQGTGMSEVFGLRDPSNGHYAVVDRAWMNSQYQLSLDVTGTWEPGSFTANVGDIIELRRTATNWEVYQNNVLQLSSATTGLLTSGDDARFFMVAGPGGVASYDYVGTQPVPEPAGLFLLGLAAAPMIRRRR